ncbi:hypothetical protein AB0G56_30665, partial [Streptomyces sp. NPDC021356]
SGAGKAGAVAKALSVAGKAGKVIDPMTYVAKGAGAGLSKIGDISKALKGMGKIDIPELPENAITLPKGSVKLPDGSFHLPEGAPIPEGATKLPDGNFKLPDDVPVVHEGAHPLHTPEGTGQVYGHPDGHIVDGNGDILIHADELDPPGAGTGAGTDLPHTPAPVKEPALVGAGAHTAADTAGHAGEHIRLGHSLDTDLGDTGRIGDNTHTTPTVHAGGDTPTIHAGGEHTPGGHPPHHTPGGHAGDHLPGGNANEHGPGPSAHHEPPSSHEESRSGGSDSSGHDGPAGRGHETTSSAGHERGTGGREGGVSGHGEEPGGGGHTDGGGGEPLGENLPDQPEPGHADHFDGWEKPTEDSGPLERGGELEHQVRDQIRGTKVKPGDVESILDTLNKTPAGKEIADTIAAGRFRDSAGFSDVVSNLSRPSELSGCLEQIRLANRLHEGGLTDISFEVKQGGHEIKPGVFTGPKTDLDLMAREADGTTHGWQFKDMTGEDSPVEASKVVRNIFKKISQLTDSHADVQTFVVDTKAPTLDMETQLGRLEKGYQGKNVQFVIRTPDRTFFIPRGGRFTPEELL